MHAHSDPRKRPHAVLLHASTQLLGITAGAANAQLEASEPESQNQQTQTVGP
jgi:hypothetical protein